MIFVHPRPEGWCEPQRLQPVWSKKEPEFQDVDQSDSKVLTARTKSRVLGVRGTGCSGQLCPFRSLVSCKEGFWCHKQDLFASQSSALSHRTCPCLSGWQWVKTTRMFLMLQSVRLEVVDLPPTHILELGHTQSRLGNGCDWVAWALLLPSCLSCLYHSSADFLCSIQRLVFFLSQPFQMLLLSERCVLSCYHTMPSSSGYQGSHWDSASATSLFPSHWSDLHLHLWQLSSSSVCLYLWI